jgi:site-specific recombinase XerC
MRKIQDQDIELGQLRNLVERYVRAERSLSTRRNYRADWNMLRAWGKSAGRPFPPSSDTIALYFAYLLACGHKVSSVNRRMSSFRHQFRTQGLPLPDLSLPAAVLAGARRELRQRPKMAAAFSVEQLAAMCRALGERPIDIRDRAILVLGFASGMRASELSSLSLSDVAFAEAGLVISIQKSKTDQEGKGRAFGLFRAERAPCPVETLRAWLQLRGADPGPLLYACKRRRCCAASRSPGRSCMAPCGATPQ